MRVGDELLVSRCACSDVRLVRGVGRRRGSAVAVGRQDRSLMSTTGAATGDPANGIGVGAEVDDLFNGTVETVCGCAGLCVRLLATPGQLSACAVTRYDYDRDEDYSDACVPSRRLP